MEVSVWFCYASMSYQAPRTLNTRFLIYGLALRQIPLTFFSAFMFYTCVFIGLSFTNNHINSL